MFPTVAEDNWAYMAEQVEDDFDWSHTHAGIELFIQDKLEGRRAAPGCPGDTPHT